jgi:N-formylmaleamate deformylase
MGANVHANGIRQHYLRYGGQGIPLILIPGITSPAVTWGFVAERLGKDFDVYVLDVRGRGLSESGPNLDYSLDACAADVVEFAKALNLSSTVVLGHSMGARIAIRAARHSEADFSKLVLVDPPVGGPAHPRPYPTSLDSFKEGLRLARRGASGEEMRKFMPTWEETQLRLRAEWLHTCEEIAVITAHRGFHEDDIHTDLPHLKPETLLVVAGAAGVILPEDVAEIKSLAPKLRVEEVPGAAHMIPWVDYEGFFRAIEPFLKIN